MKRGLLFICLLAFVMLSSSLSAQTNIYVATNGNDNNAGTLSAPLKTLQGAVNKVRSIRSSGLPSGGVIVNFRGGTYPVTSTVSMGPNESGESGRPVVYRGYKKELVIFDGAINELGAGFAKTTSSHSSKLHGNAVGKVYYKKITNNSVIDVLKGDDAQISMNGKMMNIARFPNLGFAHIDPASLTPGYETINTDGTFSSPKGARFKLYEGMNNADRFANEVKRTERIMAHGYLSALWHKESILVASGTAGWIRFKDGTSYGVQRLVDKNRPIRMYVNNVLCELDQAGEWYFDVSDNTLYVWPYEAINNESKFGVWAGPEMVNVTNGKYIQFQHMTIQHFAKRTNGDGVLDFRSGNNFFVAGVTFKYTTMASCNFWGDVTNSIMQSCNFFDCGGTRLYGGSYTSTGTIKKGNNRIQNCHFTNIHSKDFYGKATGINGAGNVFANNMIHNTNGQPLTFAGIDHYIAKNETFNVGVEEGDGGAFYTGNDLVSYGNVLKHNFFHHILSLPGVNIGRASIHVDDMDSGDKIEENIFYKGGWKAIKFGRGAGHTVQKNILLDCYQGIATGVAGLEKYNVCKDYLDSKDGKRPTDNIKANYIGRMLQKVGVSGWENNVNSSNWNTQIEQFWRNRYPYFNHVMNAYASNNTMDAYQCRFYDNMFFSSDNKDIELGGSTVAGVRGSQAVNFSMFNNHNTLTFSWKSPAPSYAPDIPFDDIGLYTDAYRCEIPSKTTYRKNVKDHFFNVPSFGGTYDRNTVNGIVYYNTGKMVTDMVGSCYTSNDDDNNNTGNGISVSFANPANGSSFASPASVYVKVNASDSDGSISNVKLYLNNNLVRQENISPYEWNASGQNDPSLKNMAAGTYTLKAIATDNSGNTKEAQTITITVTGGGTTPPTTGQTPYGGSNRNIPGTIEAEDFDNGGEGVAYHDADATNKGNNVAREDEGVDIEARDGGKSVGWVANGEWLEYTVNATAGTYKIEARVATTTANKKIVVKLGGTTLGTITAPNTGNWGSFQTVSIDNIAVSGGNNKVLRLEFDGGSINLNWVKFTSTGGTTPPPSNELITVQAESFTSTSGTINDAAWGGPGLGANKTATTINWVNNGDYMDYNVTIPDDGAYEVVYYISSPNDGSTISIGAPTPVLNTTTVPNNGNWDSYQALTASSTINLTAGNKVIRLTAGAQTWTWNLDKFTLQRTGAMKTTEAGNIIQTNTFADKGLDILVYPNPVNETLNITIDDELQSNSQLVLYSNTGKRILNQKISNDKSTLDVSGLQPGMYILKVINGKKVHSQAVIKSE